MPGGVARLIAQAKIQIAAHEQQEGQHGGGVEVCMRAVLGSLVKAKPQRQQKRNADGKIHASPPRLEAAPGGAEERHSGIERGRNGHGAREPEESLVQVWRKVAAAIPDGVGQSDHEYRGES